MNSIIIRILILLSCIFFVMINCCKKQEVIENLSERESSYQKWTKGNQPLSSYKDENEGARVIAVFTNKFDNTGLFYKKIIEKEYGTLSQNDKAIKLVHYDCTETNTMAYQEFLNLNVNYLPIVVIIDHLDNVYLSPNSKIWINDLNLGLTNFLTKTFNRQQR